MLLLGEGNVWKMKFGTVFSVYFVSVVRFVALLLFDPPYKNMHYSSTNDPPVYTKVDKTVFFHVIACGTKEIKLF